MLIVMTYRNRTSANFLTITQHHARLETTSHLKIRVCHSERSEESPSAGVRSGDSSSKTRRNDIFEISSTYLS
jgi:hypothetical protein